MTHLPLRARLGAALLLPLLPLLPLLLSACSATPPIVDKRWANEARAVIPPDTPQDGDRQSMTCGVGDDAMEIDELDGGDLGVEHKVFMLGEGVYVLEEALTIDGGVIEIRGMGPHLTRLELDTETFVSLDLRRPQGLILSGLTIAAHTGGGIRVEDCQRGVQVEDVHFVGARHGLELTNCQTTLTRVVFAGCWKGVVLDRGGVQARETIFDDCWVGIDGTGDLDLEACVFLDGHDAIGARLGWRSRIVGCLFSGEAQSLGWKGDPSEGVGNLVSLGELDPRALGADDEVRVRLLRDDDNRALHNIDQYPWNLPEGLPGVFRPAEVYLAMKRAELRGERNPPAQLEEFALQQAQRCAEGAREALRGGHVQVARRLAKFVVVFLGDTDISDAPPIVAEVAALAEE
jgi:hypothetical protein